MSLGEEMEKGLLVLGEEMEKRLVELGERDVTKGLWSWEKLPLAAFSTR